MINDIHRKRTNEPRGRPETQVDTDYLKMIVEVRPSQTMAELAAAFDIIAKTALKSSNTRRVLSCVT